MFQFVFSSILLALCIFKGICSPRYVNNCFRLLDGSGDFVNIMFDHRLRFVPKILQLTQITTDYKNELNNNVLSISSFMLRKEDRSCEDAFILVVPDGQQSIQSIIMTLSYGVEMFKIDEYNVIVNKNFKENALMVSGLLKNTVVKMVIAHGHQSITDENRRPEFDLGTVWRNNMRKLLTGELYCVDFFTYEFSGKLYFSGLFHPLNPLSEYYILSVRVHQNLYTKNMSEKKYLVRVYPCETSTSLDNILNIFADKDIMFVEFEFLAYYFHMISVTFRKELQTKLKVIYVSYPYNFDHLEINLCDITQEMVDEQVGIMLHRSNSDIERSFVQIPGVMQNLEISRRFEETVGNVILRTMVYGIDTAAEEFGIFSITVVEDSLSDQV